MTANKGWQSWMVGRRRPISSITSTEVVEPIDFHLTRPELLCSTDGSGFISLWDIKHEKEAHIKFDSSLRRTIWPVQLIK
ncbi:hypothetical protein AKJ16_DCAP18603 [Drosera capensis]